MPCRSCQPRTIDSGNGADPDPIARSDDMSTVDMSFSLCSSIVSNAGGARV
jgi:hypothetical protein